eukprot:1158773-Pelagomonas_calceolata.AAC.6
MTGTHFLPSNEYNPFLATSIATSAYALLFSKCLTGSAQNTDCKQTCTPITYPAVPRGCIERCLGLCAQPLTRSTQAVQQTWTASRHAHLCPAVPHGFIERRLSLCAQPLQL